MPRSLKNLSDHDIQSAYELMLERKLVFPLNAPGAIDRLTQFVKEKNEELYHAAEFQFIETEFDQKAIIAAVPKLGRAELGLFCGEGGFKKDEIIGTYEGKNLWGILPTKEIQKKINDCEEYGEYFWEVKCDSKTSMAIDSRMEGSAPRFINDSLNKNCYVKSENGKIYYIASRDIKFGEEITTNYGLSYFSNENPRIEYRPSTLQEILYELFSETCSAEIETSQITNLEELQEFLNANDWFEEPIEPPTTKNIDNISLDTSNKSEIKNASFEILYLDKEGNPLIFDLSNNEHVSLLSKTAALKFIPTSRYKLFVAPTGYREGLRRFSLFSSQMIEKGNTVCVIKGEELTRKEISQREDIDETFLFEINNKINLYCKEIGSEAFFLEGSLNEADANVKLGFDKNKLPQYIATNTIRPGSEILAYYGKDYPFGAKASHLKSVMDDFNNQQQLWDGSLTYHANKQSYSVNLSQHVLPSKNPVKLDASPFQGDIENPYQSLDQDEENAQKHSLEYILNADDEENETKRRRLNV